jgi:glycine/serine hydroxymethyltransferase
MGAAEMKTIASLIARAIKDGGDESKAAAIRSDVHSLTAKFPVYPRA